LGTSTEKRQYRQRKRAQIADLTRQRIIEAAREVLMESPFVAINLEKVARRAGVARSTIYAIFESRLGLFEAIKEDLRQRGGFRTIQAAFALPNARDILRDSLAAAVQLYMNEGKLWRVLELQALIDPDAATLTSRENQDRMGGMRHLARLLDEQGYLQEGVTATDARRVLSLLTDLIVYDRLTLTMELTTDQLLAFLLLSTRSFMRPDVELASS
jgi:AcrR family transcriptional regulator